MARFGEREKVGEHRGISAERLRRYQRIIDLRAEGASWVTVASAVGFSPRHCQRVFVAFAQALMDLEPSTSGHRERLYRHLSELEQALFSAVMGRRSPGTQGAPTAEETTRILNAASAQSTLDGAYVP